MTTTDIPVTGGTEAPNFSLFGLSPEANAPAPTTGAQTENAEGEVGGAVATATHHPSGIAPVGPPPNPAVPPAKRKVTGAALTDEAKAALQQGIQQVGDDTANGTNPEFAEDMAQWFQDNSPPIPAPAGTGEGGGSPAAGPTPPAPTIDPNAPVPMPVLQPDGSYAFPDASQQQAQVPPQIAAQQQAYQPQAVGQQLSPVEQRFLQAYGRLPSLQEVDALIQYGQDVANMTPQQRAAVEAAMYGTPQQQLWTPGQQPAPTPGAPVTDPFGEPDVAAVVQQQLQAALAPIQQGQQQLYQTLQQQEAARAEEYRRTVLGQFAQGRETVKQRYNLTDADTDAFQQRVADSGIMSGLMSVHPDGRSAMEAAMEQVMWADPAFRFREQARTQALQAAQEANDAERRQRAGALAGGGATVTRDEPPIPTGKSPQDRATRQAAFSNDLARFMEQS